MNLKITCVELGLPGRGKNGYSPCEMRLYDVDEQRTDFAKQGRGRACQIIAKAYAGDRRYTGPRSQWFAAKKFLTELMESVPVPESRDPRAGFSGTDSNFVSAT